MDYELLLNTYVNKTRSIKTENYKKYGYNEPIYKKMEVKVNYEETEFKSSMDFKSFHMDLKKQAKYEKTKPGNARVIDYEEDEECRKVNILKDDIFETDSKADNTMKDINEMSMKELMKDIHNYLKKKQILLAQVDIEKIEKSMEDPLFERKKYIKYSKSTRMLSKLEFIKKTSDDRYEVDFHEKKVEDKKYIRKSFFK